MLSERQIKYGEQELKRLAKRYNLQEIKMAELLCEINTLHKFCKWVNADEFLIHFLNKWKESDNG
jgi:hypothetical protein